MRAIPAGCDLILVASELEQIGQHAHREAPRECCGVILTRGTGRQIIEAKNVQDLFGPPSAERAFRVDDGSLQRILTLCQDGWRVAVIYHSHTNGFPGLSARDREAAVPAGRPLYPGAEYLVAAKRARHADGAWTFSAYAWERGEYRLAPLTVQEASGAASENLAASDAPLG